MCTSRFPVARRRKGTERAIGTVNAGFAVQSPESASPGGKTASIVYVPRRSSAIRSGWFWHRHVKCCGQFLSARRFGVVQPMRARLAASASSVALSFRKTASMASENYGCDRFAISQLSAAMDSRSSSNVGVLLILSDFHHVDGLNLLSLSSISRMRASAAASFCLSVAISAAAVAARSAMLAFVSRGRADRALPPSGLANILGDKAVIPSRHCRGNDPPGGCRDFPHSGGLRSCHRHG